MSLDKRFVRCNIVLIQKDVWKAEIVYSYYGVYEYSLVEIFDSLSGAKDWVLRQRCGSALFIKG